MIDWVALAVAAIAGAVTLVQFFLNRKDKKDEDKCGYTAAFISINERLDRREEESRVLMACMKTLLAHNVDGNHTGELQACVDKIENLEQERMWKK